LKTDDLLDRAASAARMAVSAGADAAEAWASWIEEREVRLRSGQVEKLIEADSGGIGLRVDRGLRQGFASSTDQSGAGLKALVNESMALAAGSPEDEAGLIPESSPAPAARLDLSDPDLSALDVGACIAVARRAEEAALAFDGRVTPGEGTTFAHGRRRVAIFSTRGAAASHEGTLALLSSHPVARSEHGLQRHSWYEGRRFVSDLPQPESIGRRAAERAAGMLGARSISTRRAPVVFDPLCAAGFWSALSAALLGDAARRGISFLSDDLGRPVAGPDVALVEDPLIDRAPGSIPFDGEGWPTSRRTVIEGGVLTGFLYDARSARKAGASTTGNAVRGYSTPPVPGAHALRLRPGRHSPDAILKAAGSGFLVSHLMGFGMNLATGDYSRAASGWWFEGGEIAHPVHEVTISGNLRDMLRGITMIGDDLVFRSSASSPTFLIEEMVIAGARR
jgi:PmbA protein